MLHLVCVLADELACAPCCQHKLVKLLGFIYLCLHGWAPCMHVLACMGLCMGLFAAGELSCMLYVCGACACWHASANVCWCSLQASQAACCMCDASATMNLDFAGELSCMPHDAFMVVDALHMMCAMHVHVGMHPLMTVFPAGELSRMLLVWGACAFRHASIHDCVVHAPCMLMVACMHPNHTCVFCWRAAICMCLMHARLVACIHKQIVFSCRRAELHAACVRCMCMLACSCQNFVCFLQAS